MRRSHRRVLRPSPAAAGAFIMRVDVSRYHVASITVVCDWGGRLCVVESREYWNCKAMAVPLCDSLAPSVSLSFCLIVLLAHMALRLRVSASALVDDV